MVRKGSLKKPPRLVELVNEFKDIAALDGRQGEDAMQLKIQRAEMLMIKLSDHSLLILDDLRRIKDRDCLLYWKRYPCSMDRTKPMIYWEQIMVEKYYEQRGRTTEKHRLIREQEDHIRTLRRNAVHRGNSLAAEKKLIKDLKNEEEMREKMIANGVEHIKYWQQFSSKEDIENQIKVCKDELRKQRNEQRLDSAKIDGVDKKFKLVEKEIMSLKNELMKIEKMEGEVQSFIYSLMLQLPQNQVAEDETL